jgi:hypothetical protein
MDMDDLNLSEFEPLRRTCTLQNKKTFKDIFKALPDSSLWLESYIQGIHGFLSDIDSDLATEWQENW